MIHNASVQCSVLANPYQIRLALVSVAFYQPYLFQAIGQACITFRQIAGENRRCPDI
jgi:hypothetical protein